MKVVIVNPPSRQRVYGPLSDLAAIEIPVWAGILSEYLRAFEVEILDCEVEGYSVEESAAAIEALKPDLAVFAIYGQQPSASTQCLPAAEAVASLLTCPTLALGTHPSALPEKTFQEGPWTYVARGEGHRTVMGLLRVMTGNGKLRDVKGLWYQDGANSPAGVSENLDAELGGRGLRRFDFKRYRAHNWHAFGYPSRSPYASVQTSLGCPFRCTFCCINAPFGSSGIRYWSPQNVLWAFRYLAEQGVVHVKIPDEMFLLNPAHYEPICDGLIELARETGHAFNIWAYARVDTVKPRLLEKLKQAGFNWLGIGIESGSSHVRDGVEKGRFTEEDIFATVKRVQNAGISVGANYIFGLPDDTRESMQSTLDMAISLNTEWANFYCAMAYPGSALHETAKQNGWVLPEDGPGWSGYSQYSYDCLPLPTAHLTSGEVLAFRDAAFKRYFERPEYLKFIGSRFGAYAVADVMNMNRTTLERKAA